MRIFMFCLLAVGALAVEKARKGPRNVRWAYPGPLSPGTLTKRSLLTAADDFNVNIDDQFGQQELVRYTQPGNPRISASGLVSAYTSDLNARRTGSLPVENQHQLLHPSVSGDSKAGQIFLRQLGQRFDQPANLQEQQVALGIQGYTGGSSIGGRTIETRLSSELANAPASLPHQVPFTPTVQAPRFPVEVDPAVEYPRPNPDSTHTTNVHQVNVDRTVSAQQPSEVERPASVPVPIVVREPLNYASSYEESFGPDQNVVIDDSELRGFEEPAVAFRVTQHGSFEAPNNSGSLMDHQRANVAQHRQQAFSGLYQPFPIVKDVVAHEQPDEELAVAISRVSDTQHSGYQYNAPAQTFTF